MRLGTYRICILEPRVLHWQGAIWLGSGQEPAAVTRAGNTKAQNTKKNLILLIKI